VQRALGDRPARAAAPARPGGARAAVGGGVGGGGGGGRALHRAPERAAERARRRRGGDRLGAAGGRGADRAGPHLAPGRSAFRADPAGRGGPRARAHRPPVRRPHGRLPGPAVPPRAAGGGAVSRRLLIALSAPLCLGLLGLAITACGTREDAGEDPAGAPDKPERRVTELTEPREALSQELMLALALAQNHHHKADVYLADARVEEAMAEV